MTTSDSQMSTLVTPTLTETSTSETQELPLIHPASENQLKVDTLRNPVGLKLNVDQIRELENRYQSPMENRPVSQMQEILRGKDQQIQSLTETNRLLIQLLQEALTKIPTPILNLAPLISESEEEKEKGAYVSTEDNEVPADADEEGNLWLGMINEVDPEKLNEIAEREFEETSGDDD